MDQWQVLLERFLRNECTARENKMIFHALRDGWIDDLFLSVIEFSMQSEHNNQPDAPEQILAEIKKKIQPEEKPFRQRPVIPAWLQIAATAVITLIASWMIFETVWKQAPETGMNTITVPAGQTVKLALADGTNIWLNSRSKLQYPGVFTGNRRDVSLEGEGFFEVAHQAGKPFYVHTSNYDIEVLGTKFNVEAFPGNADFTTALFEGSVKVSSVNDNTDALVLHPNTLARLSDGRLVTEAITDFNYYRWREGLISFKNLAFLDLMNRFEKCYGIKIIVENKRAKDYVCTGKFRQSDGIDYALRVLQRDVHFSFTRDDLQHVVYIR